MKHTLEATKLILIFLSAVMLTSCFYKKASSPADETTDTQPQTTETQPQTTETQPQTTEPVITTEIDLEKLEYSIEMPSEELQDRFINEFKIKYPYVEDIVRIKSWLGSYGDIHFLFVYQGAGPEMEMTVYVADSKFVYPNSNSIKVWARGQILPIKDAYEKNIITKDMVEKIADVYAKGDYIKKIK